MIKVLDLAYVKYGVKDLDVMETFLLEFGLNKTARIGGRLFMATADGAPYAYVAEQSGENCFHAFGMEASCYEDLESLVAKGYADGISEIDAPGGGNMVTLIHPDGYIFEVVHGIEQSRSTPVAEPMRHNYGTEKVRLNVSQRPGKGIAKVLRLGHCALTVSDAVQSAAWLNETMGFLTSDDLVAVDDGQKILGVFMRCDQGEDYVDHHTLFVSESPRIHIHHCSFEVQDMDTLLVGHDHLLSKGYSLEVGVGRHMAGSQIFDYWIDPCGMRIEHYADGDVMNSKFESGKISGTPEGVTQWGPVPPDAFFQ